MALSHALLRRVAAGEVAPLVRLYRPAPTLAFGRLDTHRPGFPDAVRAARAHGFEPIVRVTGGRAAAYGEGALIYEEITPAPDITEGLEARFRDGARLIARALAELGLDARVGELPGEYCPGAWSVNLEGRIKVAGTAQRVMRGAALFSAFVLVGGGARARAVLADVYAALELDWRPETAGAVEDVDASIEPGTVERALLRGEPGSVVLEPATLALAAELEPRHRVS
jgi:lipoate-protein ligase A